MLEQVRKKIESYIESLRGNKKLDDNNIIRVKSKALNSFLGIIKTDMARLAIESFPQKINKKLTSLQLLKNTDYIWFDL